MFDLLEETRKNLDGKLDAESQRYLDRSILERKLDGNFIIIQFDLIDYSLIKSISLCSKGLHLDESTRNKVKELKEKISDLQVEFSKNCNEEATKLTFTTQELDGVCEKLLNSLPKVRYVCNTNVSLN